METTTGGHDGPADAMESEHGKFAATNMDIARRFRVSLNTVKMWTRQYVDFPVKGPGGFLFDEIDAFLQQRRIGPYRVGLGGDQQKPSSCLAEARLELTREKIRTERAEADKREIELSVKAGQLLLTDDVMESHSQIAATVITILDSLQDAVDRELPERRPTDDAAWDECRRRIVEVTKRIARDCVAQIGGFIESLGESDGDE